MQSDIEAGCHLVAIAQVVYSTDSLSQRPLVQSQWLPVFHGSLKIFLSLFLMYTCTCTCSYCTGTCIYVQHMYITGVRSRGMFLERATPPSYCTSNRYCDTALVVVVWFLFSIFVSECTRIDFRAYTKKCPREACPQTLL